jgi:hypothetical protein
MDSKVNLNIPDENNTDFSLSLLNQFKRIKYNDNEFLRYSQYIVREYIINSHGRGLLCYWGMGFGKTPLAVSITEYFRVNDPTRNIIFLSAKSLANNFRNSLASYMQDIEKIPSTTIQQIIDDKYKFISSNASNMFKQIKNINKTEEDILYEKKLGEITDMFSGDRSLENSLVIVDEAHNLFNSISNGSKNAIGFYDLVMRTRNIKLIFLTGTPAVNDPFELVACFNMLKGKLYDKPKKQFTKIKKPEPEPEPESDSDSGNESDDEAEGGGPPVEYTLLPENRDDFNNWFVDYSNLEIKNKEIFQARLSGLVSYYGPVYFDKNDGQPREFFPKELPTIVKKIPMSTEQYAAYSIARDKERTEASKPQFRAKSERFSIGQKASSTYRVESRQISNFLFPKHALGPVIGLKLPEKFLNKLTDNDLSEAGLKMNSTKMLTVYQDIMDFIKSGKRLGILYSSFIVSGLKVFAKILELRGWRSYNNREIQNTRDEQEMINKINSEEIIGGRRKAYQRTFKVSGGSVNEYIYKYAIISGEIDPEDRAEIVRIFNSPENSHGGLIDLLLISSTGVEGLDLKGLRYGIMLEPYWHDARRGQFAARMIRYKSHEHLPPEERDCQLVIYLSDYPEKIPDAIKNAEKTTDINLYDESIAGKIILDKFFQSVIEASIDCNIHREKLDPEIKKRINCLLCRPTGKSLYNPNIRNDFEQERPCQKFSLEENTQNVSAKEIIIDGKKFYYTYDKSKGLDSLKIYEYNDNLDGHIEIRANNPHYPAIMEALVQIF